MIETGSGLVAETALTRKLGDVLLNEGRELVAVRHWLQGDEVIRQDIEQTPIAVVDGCVSTTIGMVPLAAMTRELKDVEDTPDVVVAAREWFHDGALVRRDVWVTVKRGHEFTIEQGKAN